MHELDIDRIDTDGAIRDSAEAAGLDRSQFIRRGVLAGGGLLAGGAMFAEHLDPAAAAISKRRSKANDVKILNYALTLEYLEAEFYRQAVANAVAGDNPQLAKFAEVVALHEANHVKLLRKALGRKAIKSPKFAFADTVTDRTKFVATSITLEDTGVRAYLGQAPNISSRAVLGTAGTIVTVEARHASWIRFIAGGAGPDTAVQALPAPATLDKPASDTAVLADVKSLGFIRG